MYRMFVSTPPAPQFCRPAPPHAEYSMPHRPSRCYTPACPPLPSPHPTRALCAVFAVWALTRGMPGVACCRSAQCIRVHSAHQDSLAASALSHTNPEAQTSGRLHTTNTAPTMTRPKGRGAQRVDGPTSHPHEQQEERKNTQCHPGEVTGRQSVANCSLPSTAMLAGCFARCQTVKKVPQHGTAHAAPCRKSRVRPSPQSHCNHASLQTRHSTASQIFSRAAFLG